MNILYTKIKLNDGFMFISGHNIIQFTFGVKIMENG